VVKRGKFTRDEVANALERNEGDVDAAYQDLSMSLESELKVLFNLNSCG